MATVREEIQSEIDAAAGILASVKAKAEADIAIADANLKTAEGKIQTFGSWLEHEITAAKDEIAAFFAAHGL